MPNTRKGSGSWVLVALGFALALLGLPEAARAETALADLVIDGQRHGTLSFQVAGNGGVLIPSTVLASELAGIVKPSVLGLVASGDRMVDAAELSRAGIVPVFDRQTLTVTIEIAPKARALSTVSVAGQPPEGKAERAVANAPLSLILGTRLALMPEVGVGPGGRPFSLEGSLGLSPAFRILGLALEANAAIDYSNEVLTWAFDNARAVLDLPRLRTRLVAGMVGTNPVSFQSGIDLWGISAGGDRGLFADNTGPGQASRGTTGFEGDIVVSRPAWVTLVVNGVEAKRLRLDPGSYRLADLPLASGLNEVTARVEEEGQAPRVIQLGLPFDPAILPPGAVDWSLSFGAPRGAAPGTAFGSLDPDAYGSLAAEPYGSAHLAFGAGKNLQLGMNLEAGGGQLLGGLSSLGATWAGTIGLDGAVSLGYGAEAVDPSWALRASWRLASEAHPFAPRLGAGLEYRAPGFLSPQAPSSADGGAPESGSLSASAQLGERLPGRAGSVTAFGQASLKNVSVPSLSASLSSWSATMALGFPTGKASHLSISGGVDWTAEGGLSPRASATFAATGRDSRTTTWNEGYSGGVESGSLAIGLGSANRAVLSLSEQGLADPLSPASVEAGASLVTDAAALSASARYAMGREGAASALSGIFGLSSTLAFAQGRAVATSSPGQALGILAPDRSLHGMGLALASLDGVSAKSPAGGAAAVEGLVPYRPVVVALDLENASPGLSLSPPSVALRPAYRSVAVIRAGERVALTVRGSLVGVDGKPLAFLSGDLVDKSGVVLPFTGTFTDEKGVFECVELAPGPATVRWSDGSTVSFQVPAKAPGGGANWVIELGALVAVPDNTGGMR